VCVDPRPITPGDAGAAATVPAEPAASAPATTSSPFAMFGGGAAIGADGAIYVGSLDGALYAIAPTGQVRWKLAAADKIAATPGVATNGTILIGTEDEHLYAIAPDGTLLWLLAFSGDVDTTPAIAHNGTIYVAGDDAHLHAFK
jgi:outer membrane protein assembly factor BamB